jgi:hypothetical protein
MAVSVSSAATLLAVISLAGCASGHPADSVSGIPRALLLQARPTGRGERFHPPPTGPVLGPCKARLGRREGVHIELFAANRVVIVPAGIGVYEPLTFSSGRITRARCYGDPTTREPTGLVLVRPGSRLSVSDLFRSWGQPLSSVQLASFRAPRGQRVAVFVNGRPWRGAPGGVPLSRHAVIVVEVGPHVPPHTSYAFPPDT